MSNIAIFAILLRLVAWEFGALSSHLGCKPWSELHLTTSCSLWFTATMTYCRRHQCNNDLNGWRHQGLFQPLSGFRFFSAPELYSSTQITHSGKLGQLTPFWQVIVAIFSLWCTTCTFPFNFLTYSDTVILWKGLQVSSFVRAMSVWRKRKILFTAQKLHLIMLRIILLRNFQLLADILILQNWW